MVALQPNLSADEFDRLPITCVVMQHPMVTEHMT